MFLGQKIEKTGTDRSSVVRLTVGSRVQIVVHTERNTDYRPVQFTKKKVNYLVAKLFGTATRNHKNKIAKKPI